MPSIDAHQVLMTGENSFIRLSHDGGKTMSDRSSHWRVLWCPAGPGHALFMQGELTDGPGTHLQRRPLGGALAATHNRDAAASAVRRRGGRGAPGGVHVREGDPRSTTVETVESDEHIIRMTWYDCIEPFILNVPPGTAGRPLGVLSTFIAARSAQLTVNDRVGNARVASPLVPDELGASRRLNVLAEAPGRRTMAVDCFGQCTSLNVTASPRLDHRW